MPSSPISRSLHATIADLEHDLDLFDDLLAQGEGHNHKVRLLAYAGATSVRPGSRGASFATKSRSTREKGLTRLRAMLEIYNSNELPGIEVRCEGYGRTASCTTDHEGYFSFDLDLSSPLPEQTKRENVLLSTPKRQAQQAAIKVPILAPGKDGNWGVISDIDDTVVETGATDFLKNWRRVVLDRPEDRLAVLARHRSTR